MGSDNRTTRRWLSPSPKRFHIYNSLRCGMKLMLLTTLIYSTFLIFIGNAKRHGATNTNYHQSKIQQTLDVCSRDVYNINTTCEAERCYVIVLTINMGFYDFFLNWFHYYYTSLHNNTNDQICLVVIAEDNEIYQKMQLLNLENAAIISSATKQSVGSPEDYDSVGYKSLVSGRASHLLNLICGLNGHATTSEQSDIDWETRWIIIYSDIDTVWLKNPIPIIQANLLGENQSLQYHLLAGVDDHDFEGYENYYCTGLLVFTNTAQSILFLSRWEEKLNTNPQLNQPIFNQLLQRDEQFSLLYMGLNETLFPPGRTFFYGSTSKDDLLSQTVVVHNNYIIGRDSKKKRFKEYGLWMAD